MIVKVSHDNQAACVQLLAQLAGARPLFRQRVWTCYDVLRQFSDWDPFFSCSQEILENVGIFGGWELLRGVEPYDSPGNYHAMQGCRVSIDADIGSHEIGQLPPGEHFEIIQMVMFADEDTLRGRITEGWITVFQSCDRYAVKEVAPAKMAGSPSFVPDSEVEKDQVFADFMDVADEAERIEELYHLFQRFCELALLAAESEDQQSEVLAVRAQTAQTWSEYGRNSQLHYVFGGLVSSGKTTLLNSWLINSLKDFPSGIELLPSDMLENTATIAILDVSAAHEQLSVRKETVQVVDDRAASETLVISAKATAASVERLQEDVKVVLQQLQKEPGWIRRLVVELPFQFAPLQGVQKTKANWLSHRLRSFGIWGAPKNSKMSMRNMSPVIVDTPGLDSMFVKHQLLNLLEEKTCVYCYLVDMMKPSPFGNQGFETLKYLMDNLQAPFPPVIVFTKYEMFTSLRMPSSERK